MKLLNIFIPLVIVLAACDQNDPSLRQDETSPDPTAVKGNIIDLAGLTIECDKELCGEGNILDENWNSSGSHRRYFLSGISKWEDTGFRRTAPTYYYAYRTLTVSIYSPDVKNESCRLMQELGAKSLFKGRAKVGEPTPIGVRQEGFNWNGISNLGSVAMQLDRVWLDEDGFPVTKMQLEDGESLDDYKICFDFQELEKPIEVTIANENGQQKRFMVNKEVLPEWLASKHLRLKERL